MVHAGLLPAWDVDKAAALSREVEAALQAPDYRFFLANMWGSTPTAWSDDLVGWDRLRVVVNAMTRMRFCTAAGAIEFKAKGPVASAPAGCLPWFEVPGRASADHAIVCGHWSALGLLLRPNLIGLDSGCVWGGQLTAVRLHDRQLLQVPCPSYRQPGGKN